LYASTPVGQEPARDARGRFTRGPVRAKGGVQAQGRRLGPAGCFQFSEALAHRPAGKAGLGRQPGRVLAGLQGQQQPDELGRRSQAAGKEQGSRGGNFNAELREQGIICRNMGDAIALCPPLVIQPNEVRSILDKFASALDTVSRKIFDGATEKVA